MFKVGNLRVHRLSNVYIAIVHVSNTDSDENQYQNIRMNHDIRNKNLEKC